MSEALYFGANGPPSAGFTVTKRDGCTLVQGSMPIDEFVALTKTSGRGAVISPHLARLACATFAWGPPEAVDALTKRLTEHLGAAKVGLARWMAVGDHGNSSLAIVHHLTARRVAEDPTAHPHDAGDLFRCVTLLDMAPELRRSFSRMADVSPQWAALIESWTELEALLADKDARRLNARMREILEGAKQ